MSSVRIFYPSHSKEELVASLRQRLPALERVLPLRRAVLFGSWARGRATAASDIDLLLVYSGDPSESAYASAWRALAISGLELHLYSEHEAEQSAETLAQMSRGGIELPVGDEAD